MGDGENESTQRITSIRKRNRCATGDRPHDVLVSLRFCPSASASVPVAVSGSSRCLALRQLRKALTSASADAKFPFSLTVILTWSARRSEHQSRQLFLVHPPRRALFLSPIGLWTACSSEVTHVDVPFCPSTRRSPGHVVLGAPLRRVQHSAAHHTSSRSPPPSLRLLLLPRLRHPMFLADSLEYNPLANISIWVLKTLPRMLF